MTSSPGIPAAGPGVSAARLSMSVIICVYTEKRWDNIIAAVGSVRIQTPPPAETIIVVDHNPALYKRLVAVLADVTVVENSREKGLSGGRNTGSALARGDIIVFLDDDAFADQDWLKYLAQDYADPAVTGVGGLTLPDWQTARPAWMPEEFLWVVGSNYRGMPPSGAPVRNLLGGNMSFRREVFDLAGGFQTGIGRTAAALPLGCEETLFCIGLARTSPGALLIMDHRAKVWHFVPDGRCRFSYFLTRCWAEGISKAQVAAFVGSGDGLSTERSYVTRALPLGVARGVADLLRGDPAGLSRAGAIVIGLAVTAAGYLRTRLGRARRPPAT